MMEFKVPIKTILTKEDLEKFQTSTSYNDYMEFIQDLNSSVEGKSTRSEVNSSQIIEDLDGLLTKLIELIGEIQPEPVGKSRFGNPAFKTWYQRVNQMLPELLSFVQPNEAIPEIGKYLGESFGNSQRIDYGTGHEANFLFFLLCLKKLNLIKESDYSAIVLKTFDSYITLMRRLQFDYWLEPAGSHGVWGLDDYHFLPFLFGSSQLIDHTHLTPKSIHNTALVEDLAQDYLYMAAIHFVNSVKSESLRWHSPMLDDISVVKAWSKVNQGMFKMYRAEVLNKLPIAQHFMFGSLIPFATGHEVPESDANCTHSHVYAYGQEAPSCCSVRIPSAIGAARASGSNHQLKPLRLPFD